MTIEELKQLVCNTIDKNSDKLISFAKDLEKCPELGFKEERTSEKVCQFFKELNLPYRNKLAITGVKAKLKENSSGPNVAILGELDGVICFDSPKANKETGASHTCGHNLQITRN